MMRTSEPLPPSFLTSTRPQQHQRLTPVARGTEGEQIGAIATRLPPFVSANFSIVTRAAPSRPIGVPIL